MFTSTCLLIASLNLNLSSRLWWLANINNLMCESENATNYSQLTPLIVVVVAFLLIILSSFQ